MTVLVHIGYHKTGTSWLQKHLFRNPEAGLQFVGKRKLDHPVREIIRARPLEFDARASRAEFEPLLQKAEADGLLPVVSYERLSGHPSSGGFDSKEIADRLAQVFPDGRVLVVIREQRGVILSVYKQYVLAGGPCTLRDFLEPPFDKNMRVPGFDFRFYEYEHLLRHYRALFGADRVLALPYEGFVRDPGGFVSEIARFAGRPLRDEVLAALPFDARPHRTPSTVVIGVTRRGNRLARRSQYHPAPLIESRWLHARVESLARAGAIEALVPQRLAARSEAALQAAAAELVGDRYRESNRATAELTGLDLGGYGWTV